MLISHCLKIDAPELVMTYKFNLENTQDKIINTANELVNHIIQYSGSVFIATNKEAIYKKCFGKKIKKNRK